MPLAERGSAISADVVVLAARGPARLLVFVGPERHSEQLQPDEPVDLGFKGTVESGALELRVGNVLVSHLRASRYDGLVVMDRHLYCQLALRTANGLPRGRLLPWLLARLPEPDAIFHLDIEPAEAYRRIVARGTDSETLDDLAAFQSGYRELPEYAGFVKLDASVPAHELAADLASRLALPSVTKPD